jgi:hypothetical protein
MYLLVEFQFWWARGGCVARGTFELDDEMESWVLNNGRYGIHLDQPNPVQIKSIQIMKHHQELSVDVDDIDDDVTVDDLMKIARKHLETIASSVGHIDQKYVDCVWKVNRCSCRGGCDWAPYPGDSFHL